MLGKDLSQKVVIICYQLLQAMGPTLGIPDVLKGDINPKPMPKQPSHV